VSTPNTFWSMSGVQTVHMRVEALVHRDQDSVRTSIREHADKYQEGIMDPVEFFVGVSIETTST